MRFQEIPGMEKEKASLIESVQTNHVAHAQLFTGADGSANLALALAFATYINCLQPTETDACGQCSSCQKNKKYIHPDVHFIFPTAATDKYKREDAVSEKFLKEWRSFLLEQPYGNVEDWAGFYGWDDKRLIIPVKESRNIITALSLKSFEGKYKIMLIWYPETMGAQAANAILKVLEEPPGKTLFLLVARDPSALLNTILSRVQQFAIPPFADEHIKQVLLTREGLAPEEVDRMAYEADGNMRQALQMQDEGTDVAEYFRQWMRHCFKVSFTEMVQMSSDFQKQGKSFQQSLLRTTLILLRETLLEGIQAQEVSRLPNGERDFVEKFATVFNPDKVAQIVPLISEAQYHLERNASAKILFLDLSLSIAQIAKA